MKLYKSPSNRNRTKANFAAFNQPWVNETQEKENLFCVLYYHRTFIAEFNFPFHAGARRTDAPGWFHGEMDPSVFIILKNTDLVLQNAPGVNLYFIFATRQLTCITSKCRFITSEEATLRSNIHFVKRIHSNPSDNKDLPTSF